MRILVAYDGSPASEAAVEEVLHRPWPGGTEVRLVTVVEHPVLCMPSHRFASAPVAERVHRSLHEEAKERIRGVLERFGDRPDLLASYELREGGPKVALLEAIRSWNADLVMAGSQAGPGTPWLFLGGVCHALLAYAPCSVEVVKIRPAA